MNPLALTQSQQSTPSLPGTWRLEAKRAVTLRPREDGVLRIAHGRVWLTFDGPHAGPANDSGDRVLGAGEQVTVRAGRRVVLESSEKGVPAYISWDFVSQLRPVRTPRLQAVAQSWLDLQLATGLGLRAAWRLGAALAALALGSLMPRPAARNECAAT
ncbi:DUF2917 domain-containing protein [Ramlibacter humi]|nr:DUF2917 domain-containing protein [Ramlibacter humi]